MSESYKYSLSQLFQEIGNRHLKWISSQQYLLDVVLQGLRPGLLEMWQCVCLSYCMPRLMPLRQYFVPSRYVSGG